MQNHKTLSQSKCKILKVVSFLGVIFLIFLKTGTIKIVSDQSTLL